jgi:hypothetical protein
VGLDWQRLKELAPQQIGFVARVLEGPKVAGAQVLRFNGEHFDLNPWRVYLGPWRPKSQILVRTVDDEIIADFAFPATVDLRGWNPEAQIAQSNSLLVYALVKWGSGGFQQSALVDWPVAGLLLQVSGSYVEVNAIAIPRAVTDTEDAADPSKLPDLAATLAEEPGGGDASRAATFTYPFQSLDWATIVPDPTTGNVGINFPVPPFSRKVSFAFDNSGPVDDAANYATTAIIRFRHPDSTTLEEGVYFYDFSSADELDSVVLEMAVPAGCGYVRVEFLFPVTVTPTAGVGASFELDL